MLDDTLEVVRRDLAAFSDPGSPVAVGQDGATWIQRKEHRSIRFLQGNGDFPDVEYRDRRSSYAEFFASDDMADLRALADHIYGTMDTPKSYVEGKARVDTSGDPQSAGELLKDLCREAPFMKTNLIFLKGDAGGGKTMLLRELAISRAKAYMAGTERAVFLYIDAQARALSRIDDALAAVLQDLRAAFTYHAIPILCRLGILVPIIDGFDELLGVGGYAEAFSSLAVFVSRLDSRGTVVASARSSFYDYSDFAEVARKMSTHRQDSFNYVLRPVDLCPWDEWDIKQYIKASGVTPAMGSEETVLRRVNDTLVQSGERLSSSPFFLSTFVSALKDGAELSVQGRVLPAIVKSFLEREVEKFKDKNDSPVLPLSGHIRFLEELADEMWWQQTREVNEDTVRTVASIVADEAGLSADATRTVLERVMSHALLESRGSNRLAFNHEYFYAFFLAARMAAAIVRGDGVSRLLSRASVSSVIADEVMGALAESRRTVSDLVTSLNSVAIPSGAKETVRGNKGAMFCAAIRKGCGNEVFSDSLFDRSDLRETRLDGVTFDRCEFNRPDLRSVEWRGIKVVSSKFMLPLVAESQGHFSVTNFESSTMLSGLAVLNSEGEEERIFDPSRIRAIMTKLGSIDQQELNLPVVEETPKEIARRIAVVKKFSRMCEKIYKFSDDDLKNRRLLGDEDWEIVFKALKTSALLEEIRVSRRGPTSSMWRLACPVRELEKGESGLSTDGRVMAFWRDVRA